MKRCHVVDCSNKLGNRNKYGYCQQHRHLSLEFKSLRKKVQARYYSNLSTEQKKNNQKRTNVCKDSKRSFERLMYLNHIRTMSKEERKNFFIQKRRAYNAAYEKNRKNKDLTFKISKNLRSRLSKAITNKSSTSTILALGCSIKELKIHLESKFQPGMSWDNYGHKGWHIDHIKPLCSFDLTNEEQFKAACHYTNLQPLWWYDNLSKISNDKENL